MLVRQKSLISFLADRRQLSELFALFIWFGYASSVGDKPLTRYMATGSLNVGRLLNAELNAEDAILCSLESSKTGERVLSFSRGALQLETVS